MCKLVAHFFTAYFMSTTSNPLRYLTSLCFISLFAITAWSSGQPTLSPTEILEKTLAALRGVHTATYNVTKHIYPTPLDSFFIKENKFRYIECENPADTSGLAQHIVFYTDGSLYNSYDGKRRIYGRGNYLDATDLSRWFGVRTFEPPFFNNVTRLCEYLLKPSDIKQVTVEDCGDTWLVKAVVKEYQLLVFYGNPYIMPSLPYVESHFGFRVSKTDMLPVWLSFLSGNPQLRYETEVSDVKYNPFTPEEFSVDKYLPDLPIYYDEEEREASRDAAKRHQEFVKHSPLPTDTLPLIGGGEISLSMQDNKVKLVLFTSTYCGVCRYSYKTISQLYHTYPADSVAVWGVIQESTAHPEALLRYRDKHQIDFPIARDNGNFYHHFFPSGLAPAMLVIGKDNKILYWQNGFDVRNPKKIEKRLREGIERGLAGTTAD